MTKGMGCLCGERKETFVVIKRLITVLIILCVFCASAVSSPAYGDTWSQTTFPDGTFTNTITSTNSSEVILKRNPDIINLGTGADGGWTISSAVNINVNTNGNGGRTDPDGVNWQISNNIASGQTTISSGIARPTGFAIRSVTHTSQ
jgi:hypothetical protein